MDDSRQVKNAEVEVTIEAERVASEVSGLVKEVNKYDDWGDASNEEIEEAIRKVESWKRRFSKIEDRIYSMKKNVLRYDLASIELDKSTNMTETLKEEMEIAIRVIEVEDEVRGIYSLSTSKASEVELPKFGGKPHENFTKFKTEMLRGFKSNKVRREDQVNKLRENLFGQPRTMIPSSMGSIKDAWKILQDMYGDSVMVMNAKMLELRILKEKGGYPRKGDGLSLLKAQIDWIIRLEVTLYDIMELGEQSKQLDRNAFCSATLASVMNLFPFEMQDALEREMQPAKEDGKARMYFIIKYLRDLRQIRQSMLRTEEYSSLSTGKSNEKYVKRENVQNPTSTKYREQMNRCQNEILEIRQKVYSKLNEGQNAFSVMKKFKSKVEMFLRSYEGDLSYVEEKHWRDKIVITEKAVVRRTKELKAAKESPSSKVENLAPSVQEIFDAVKAQELILENLPEPPDVDEIEVKLERLKKFNKKLLNDRKIRERVKIRKDEVKKVDNKVSTTNANDVKMIKETRDDNFFDIYEYESTESYGENDEEASTNGAIKEYNDEVVDVIVHETSENEDIRSINDREYQAEVNEFNDWYYSKLDERRKVADKTTKGLYDKIAPSTDSMHGRYDEIMYKQVLGGERNVDKVDGVNASKIVPLLQAIFAMLLVTGKTIHEQSLQVSRLSKLSQPSLLSHHLHSEASLSPRSPCFRQTRRRACCKATNAFTEKVSSMVNAASSGVLWFKQITVLLNARERER